MDRMKITILGLDRDAVHVHSENIRQLLNKKGADYNGPYPPPAFESDIHLDEIEDYPPSQWGDDVPYWLSDLEIDAKQRERLTAVDWADKVTTFSLYCRLFKVYNSDPIRSVMSISFPEHVCMLVNIDTIKTHGHGRRVPYTYDPGRGHITDTDYDAHN